MPQWLPRQWLGAVHPKSAACTYQRRGRPHTGLGYRRAPCWSSTRTELGSCSISPVRQGRHRRTGQWPPGDVPDPRPAYETSPTSEATHHRAVRVRFREHAPSRRPVPGRKARRVRKCVHAARRYSCTRPPSRSRRCTRSGRSSARVVIPAAGSGDSSLSARCGRCWL